MIVGCALVASCANVECSLNSECGDHARCELNRCVRDCVQDRDCAEGELCSLNGVCAVRTATDDRPAPKDTPSVDAEPDASVDAAPDVIAPRDAEVPFDQFAPDVPPRDVPPVDVPPADVPPVDAPTMDLTVLDRPVLDVASMDLPVMDAPVIDVPVIDAPVIDTAPADAPRDVPTVDVPLGPVGVGVYEYTGVRPGALVAPVAVAWHPSGSYALVLSAHNTVFRYDPAAMSVTQVATTAADVAWRSVSFLADGSRALLIGNTSTSGGTTTRRGRVWVWDHAASMLTERTSDQWTGGLYYALRWNRDGSRAALLGSGTSSFTVWFYGADGTRTGSPIANGLPSGAGCNDLGWITDGFGDPALAIVCGINTAAIITATNLTAMPLFATTVAPGAVSNVGSIAVRPQGDVALVVDYTSKLGYYRDFRWTTGFGTPTLAGAAAVTFSTDGARALAYGGFGRLHEYRYDLYRASDIVDVSITNLSIAPFTQPSGATLNAVAWRPGCEEGLAVGGANSSGATSAFVAAFRVTNGRRCP